MSIDLPVTSITSIGQVAEKELRKLGISTIRDLIFYYPYRFEDFTVRCAIGDLKAHSTVTIQGTVKLLENRRSWRTKRIVTEALISDETGSVKALWFNQPFIVKNIAIGDVVSLSGRTSDNYYDLQLVSPMYEKIIPGREPVHTGRLVPVYSLTAKLHQKQFRNFIKRALLACAESLVDHLPANILAQEKLLPLPRALEAIHTPSEETEANMAKRRFAFDELFLLQLCNLVTRKNIARHPARSIEFHKKETNDFVSSLPFVLTKSQKQAAWEILRDMEKASPMNRLLEGDVGSGKTVVAALAILNAARSGYQCALMAPTEILAHQHFKTLASLFQKTPFRIALCASSNFQSWDHASGFTRYATKKERSILFEHIRSGQADVVIGTHALLEEKVRFENLAIAVIDEQHRFGVEQRKALCDKNADGTMPHLLSMTATPIPRSLALTVYGDLDLTLIQGTPHGRKRIITKIVPQEYREWVYDFIKKEIVRGYQAFIICPLIDPSDVLGVRSVTQEAKRLREGELSSVRLGILHGKMKSNEKEAVMRGVASGEIDVLLSTSVVEVGIDIPRATVVLIEGAERFGLAQLHQFRGRVGRSSRQSYCFLLPTESTKEDRARLKAVVASHDGFALAEKDLMLRGEGDVFGERQSGMSRLAFSSITDAELVKKTRLYAEHYLPRLGEFPNLNKRVEILQRYSHLE
ncbi:ATP-dependent DNA helicase RecG [Candidatus Uhrbacteria bacterium]|nr:ATP-dependent DNA helicase RecG [Candidatus Uhrbacteria bacterium]